MEVTNRMANVTDLLIESLVSSRTKEPVVQLTVKLDNGQTVVQFTPEQARSTAQVLMQAAESAVIDTFILKWVKDVLEQDEITAAHIMKDFREFREARVARNTEVPENVPEEEKSV